MSVNLNPVTCLFYSHGTMESSSVALSICVQLTQTSTQITSSLCLTLLASLHIISYHIISHLITSLHVISHHITSHNFTFLNSFTPTSLTLTHSLGVDILPSELPKDSSEHFGKALSPLLPPLLLSKGSSSPNDLSDLPPELRRY